MYVASMPRTRPSNAKPPATSAEPYHGVESISLTLVTTCGVFAPGAMTPRTRDQTDRSTVQCRLRGHMPVGRESWGWLGTVRPHVGGGRRRLSRGEHDLPRWLVQRQAAAVTG